MTLDLDDLERRLDEGYGLNDSQERALLAEVRRLMAQAALMDTNRIAWREWSQDLCAALDAAGVERPKPLTDSAYVARYNADPPEAGFSVDLDWALKGAPAPSATGEERPRRLALPKGSESISIYPDGRVEVDVGCGFVFSESAANAIGIQERIDAAPAAPKEGERTYPMTASEVAAEAQMRPWLELHSLKEASLARQYPAAPMLGGPLPYPCPYMGPRGAMQAARWGAFPESSR